MSLEPFLEASDVRNQSRSLRSARGHRGVARQQHAAGVQLGDGYLGDVVGGGAGRRCDGSDRHERRRRRLARQQYVAGLQRPAGHVDNVVGGRSGHRCHHKGRRQHGGRSSPVNNTLQAYSAVTGAWATLSAVVQDTGATVLVGTNVAVVVSPVNNTLQAFSALTGAWATLSAVVQDTGAVILATGNTAVVVSPVNQHAAGLQCHHGSVGDAVGCRAGHGRNGARWHQLRPWWSRRSTTRCRPSAR